MLSLPDVNDLRVKEVVACEVDNPCKGDVAWLLKIHRLMMVEGEYIILFRGDMDKWPTLYRQLKEVWRQLLMDEIPVSVTPFHFNALQFVAVDFKKGSSNSTQIF